MRVLNISAQKPDSTGSGVYLAQTVRSMAAAGHDVAVVCGVDALDDPASHLPIGTELFDVRFNTPQLPFNVCGMSDVMPYPATRYRDLDDDMLRMFKSAFSETILRAAREFRPDVVVAHHLYLVTAIAREMLPDVPIGAISHSTDLRQMKQHDLEQEYISEMIPQLDHVFALHNDQREEILERFDLPPERVHVVGVGYDHELFCMPEGCGDADEGEGASGSDGAGAGAGAGAGTGAGAVEGASGRAGAGVREDAANADDTNTDDTNAINLLYVGKISFLKGVQQLMSALGTLEDEGFHTNTVLAGGHSNAFQYECLVNMAQTLGLETDFAGPLPQQQLASLYQKADIFVLPSFYEGLPLVMVEALACDCKVVITDLPGIREFFDEFVPGAPIVYVKRPRLLDMDSPYAEDLSDFSADLAEGIKQAAQLQPGDFDIESLSWARLAQRMLDHLTA